ncbi:two-component system sensor histidine kinase NtrB [Denitratisoma oestradiolicum]|uniref:Sensory histidine kinase/phosphatase NtrB n=1 Tax=Denitratisoma oestradiolicum TaxID=311182 RepID=A0A6S6XYJ9_9PROT|nr:ATP-binding protein [Denitratisoma oestradiolicum]TWO80662.1 PAS domain-containing sensor histidine kinase [Denitratisoma oestradiolicum]CAB1371066.1 PAS domain-containing sensor histidine kinase [Denitratisoma oestradiolicum]
MNAPDSSLPQSTFGGLDLLSSAVILLDGQQRIRHLNPAAENLFAASLRTWQGRPLEQLLGHSPTLLSALENALNNNWSYTGHNIKIERGEQPALHLDCTVTPGDVKGVHLLLEFRPIDQQLKTAREEREAVQQQATRELIRNLAHEIKNPLGGIRGSAQLLERELASLPNAPALREYTEVIIAEADRLQDLMQRLLSSHRAMQPAPINIHEILERVLRLIHAEFTGVRVHRDYDTSLPKLTGDREQLIQAILNIARNAAQAIVGMPPGPLAEQGGDNGSSLRDSSYGGLALGRPGGKAGMPPGPPAEGGEIVFRTRAARQVTLAKKLYPLALELHVIDNGPGIAEDMRDKIFYPLVSGREGGSGLGLTLTQSFIQQHHGSIEVESRPGRTCFRILLPLSNEQGRQL